MKKIVLIALWAGTVALWSGCGDGEYRDGAETGGTVGDVPASTPPVQREGSTALYRQQAERVATLIAADLQLNPQARNRVQQAYFERAVKMAEFRAKDNTAISNRRAELNNNVGVVSNAGTNNATGARIGTPSPTREEDLQTIQQETAETLRGILTPDQFARFEANRNRYDQMR